MRNRSKSITWGVCTNDIHLWPKVRERERQINQRMLGQKTTILVAISGILTILGCICGVAPGVLLTGRSFFLITKHTDDVRWAAYPRLGLVAGLLVLILILLVIAAVVFQYKVCCRRDRLNTELILNWRKAMSSTRTVPLLTECSIQGKINSLTVPFQTYRSLGRFVKRDKGLLIFISFLVLTTGTLLGVLCELLLKAVQASQSFSYRHPTDEKGSWTMFLF